MTAPMPMLERAAHARELPAQEIDAWVASASAEGEAYMIPLSYHWTGSAMVFSTPRNSRTMRDLKRTGGTRVALPPARDVVILDGRIEMIPPDSAEADACVAQHTWDPRNESKPYDFFRFIPETIQAWRVESELPTRVVMRNGLWLDEAETMV
jgi:nitroimidazol reductase NimA-like FMN-containing flavoprotein (pyridoxamine 5'-phosphate oxidase superfamily)